MIRNSNSITISNHTENSFIFFKIRMSAIGSITLSGCVMAITTTSFTTSKVNYLVGQTVGSSSIAQDTDYYIYIGSAGEYTLSFNDITKVTTFEAYCKEVGAGQMGLSFTGVCMSHGDLSKFVNVQQLGMRYGVIDLNAMNYQALSTFSHATMLHVGSSNRHPLKTTVMPSGVVSYNCDFKEVPASFANIASSCHELFILSQPSWNPLGNQTITAQHQCTYIQIETNAIETSATNQLIADFVWAKIKNEATSKVNVPLAVKVLLENRTGRLFQFE